MEHFIVKESPINLTRVQYDLALIYAREKFSYALRCGDIPNNSPDFPHPDFLDETEYLLKLFSCAISEFRNQDEEELLKMLDFTYEYDA